jgi:hypothetical protein
MQYNDYPAKVVALIDTIVELISETLPLSTVLLLGSAARNELSYLLHSIDNLELFSDLEFMAVTHRRPIPIQRKTINDHLTSLEQQVSNRNPLFHIDILFREQRRLPSLPRFIFTYEMKQNALLLHGDDIRDLIPEVTLDNLDFRNTHEILFKRLWAMLLYIPKSFLFGTPNAPAQRTAGYTFCRNALDLTTVFLPQEGLLLPTYRQRVNALTNNIVSLSEYFGNDFPSFVQMCLERRLHPDFSPDELPSLYTNTVNALEHGLLSLLPETSILILPRYSSRIFNERPMSQGEWYNLFRLVVRASSRLDLIKAMRWLFLPVKGWLALGLLMMHKAAIAWLHNNTKVADDFLNQSELTLQKIAFIPYTPNGTAFPSRWLALRRSWGDIWLQAIRLGAKSAEEHIDRALGWEYE